MMTQRNFRTPYPTEKGGAASHRQHRPSLGGDLRGVTPSLIDYILTAQSTGRAIYSHRSARRKTRPAANSCGGKSGHPVQPHLCHSQPRRSISWENHSSHHARRKLPPAVNSAGGKSDHSVTVHRGRVHPGITPHSSETIHGTCHLWDTICLS